MASPGSSSWYGVGWLFAIAMVTSLMWYLFWLVMAPVKLDISSILNWYIFMKLKLNKQYDVYNGMMVVHNWLPLVVITALILSKVSLIYRNYLLKLSQVVYVVVIVYNFLLLVFLLYAGWKVIQLFMVTLPLYLLLHVGPLLSCLFSPHTLWVSTSLCLLLYYLVCRHTPSSDKRHHKAYGLWDVTAVGATKRVLVTFSLPILLTVLTYFIMERACLPCSSSYSGTSVPPKPLLVAHRGCMLDSPENSVAAFETAAKLPGMLGLETDVSVGMDGVMFLMHDPHLIRVTDVLSKCPSLDSWSNASLLYYYNGSCPINKLNIGQSFLDSNQIKLSSDETSLYSLQLVPTFRDFLEVAKREGKVVIFDVNEPPIGHPYHHSYLNNTLADIVASGLPHNKVWWLPRERRQWVYNKFPNMIQTTKTELIAFKDLRTEHIQKINDDWSTPLRKFHRYQETNISLNMFFVDSPFMFSYAWCVGVHSVTTSNCKLLSSINTNAFIKICRKWHFEYDYSRPLMLGGLTVVGMEILLLISWEILRLTGYWQNSRR